VAGRGSLQGEKDLGRNQQKPQKTFVHILVKREKSARGKQSRSATVLAGHWKPGTYGDETKKRAPLWGKRLTRSEDSLDTGTQKTRKDVLATERRPGTFLNRVQKGRTRKETLKKKGKRRKKRLRHESSKGQENT